ncbi:MAG: decaprenyl-phosphate phosphoribosyltransferase [Anaerolineales bacterium]|nr:decaprenyl-phosphate phosphoribosyltransferase [Anaerolineales bacterium]MCX7755252.1 decaprenyl-phosphate phosphoribosyltransferase [Anaerolineales bacterium]MDW8278917.1 decaprenyl-phosphate phosphoribosyltransferase [Anaerolineales bacterium]
MFLALLKTMRPRQWTKNGFVFFALIFDKQLFQLEPLLRTLGGFILFCLISSVVYLVNDIADIEADRQHPEKKKRPLPSGQLSVKLAWSVAIGLIVLVLPLGWLLSPAFAGVLTAYLVLNLAYSKWLKHIPIVDVLVIAAGFVLRVHGGVTLIQVERFSPWLYVVTTLGSLYLGFGKRRAELSLLDQGAGSHRRVLEGYTIPLLDQYVTIVSAATILAYSLYTFSAPNLPENHIMMLTIPFVVYIIFRYLYLIQVTHEAGAPEEVLLKDIPIQIAILLFGLTVFIVFYLS